MRDQRKPPVILRVKPLKKRTPRQPSQSSLLFDKELTPHSSSIIGIWSISIVCTLREFCKHTTLHGVRNIFEAMENLLSRSATRQQKFYNMLSLIIWLVALCLGTVFAILLMGLIWDRFKRTPTITTVETNNYAIWNVEFPAVTVCNNNKVYAPAARSMARAL